MSKMRKMLHNLTFKEYVEIFKCLMLLIIAYQLLDLREGVFVEDGYMEVTAYRYGEPFEVEIVEQPIEVEIVKEPESGLDVYVTNPFLGVEVFNARPIKVDVENTPDVYVR